MTNVKGKWALLTGASRGIGYQTAVFMAKQGCNLVLHSRSLENSKKVLEEVLALGVEAYAVAADLGDMNQVNSMLAEIDRKGTPVEIVLNNAGIQTAYRMDYLTTQADDFVQCNNVNTLAPMMICYHYLPRMIENGFGRLVNTTSKINHDPQQAGYSASKAALDKVSIDLGTKLQGTGVTINLANPGWCRTDLGGPQAPCSVESVIPGIVVGAFINDKKSGRIIEAQDFVGKTIEEAVKITEETLDSPY